MILSASSDHAPALERLCRTYWRPVYVYCRATGLTPEQAEDATQDFFADIFRRDWLKLADPERGSFRGFLRKSVGQFLANRWRREQAQKRRAERVVPIDSENGERELANLASPDADPAALYEKSWAECVLQTARTRLTEEKSKSDQPQNFDQLLPFLSRPPTPGEYAELAEKLQVSRAQVALIVHRLSRRFADLVRAEVASTLENSKAVNDELRHLLNIVSQS